MKEASALFAAGPSAAPGFEASPAVPAAGTPDDGAHFFDSLTRRHSSSLGPAGLQSFSAPAAESVIFFPPEDIQPGPEPAGVPMLAPPPPGRRSMALHTPPLHSQSEKIRSRPLDIGAVSLDDFEDAVQPSDFSVDLRRAAPPRKSASSNRLSSSASSSPQKTAVSRLAPPPPAGPGSARPNGVDNLSPGSLHRRFTSFSSIRDFHNRTLASTAQAGTGWLPPLSPTSGDSSPAQSPTPDSARRHTPQSSSPSESPSARIILQAQRPSEPEQEPKNAPERAGAARAKAPGTPERTRPETASQPSPVGSPVPRGSPMPRTRRGLSSSSFSLSRSDSASQFAESVADADPLRGSRRRRRVVSSAAGAEAVTTADGYMAPPPTLDNPSALSPRSIAQSKATRSRRSGSRSKSQHQETDWLAIAAYSMMGFGLLFWVLAIIAYAGHFPPWLLP